MNRPFQLATCLFDWSLFVGSYAPLFLIAALRWEAHRELIASLVICFAGAATPTLVILFASARQQGRPYEITAVESRADANAGYLAGYLLPFVTVDAPDHWNVWAAYAVFIWLVGLISTRGQLLYVNPLLYVLRYEIARVVTTDGTFNVIARGTLRSRETISATRLLEVGPISGGSR